MDYQGLTCLTESWGHRELVLDVAVDIHFATPPVQAMTLVECDPIEAQQAATRLWIEDGSGTVHEDEAPLPRSVPWRHKVPAGQCTLNLEFDAEAPWENVSVTSIAVPPLFKPAAIVKPRAARLTAQPQPEPDVALERGHG